MKPCGRLSRVASYRLHYMVTLPVMLQKRFAPTKLFLDTNLVFSLLGLHNDLFNKRAAELNSLIENEKSFELWLFDFTLEEIIRVLKAYLVTGINILVVLMWQLYIAACLKKEYLNRIY